MANLIRRLEGKVALITGGASRIGEATAKLFTKHGAKVTIADINDNYSSSTTIDDSSSSDPITYIHCDITNEEHVMIAVDRTVSDHGKLDIVFNNAGLSDRPKPRITDNEKSDFERVLKTNVTGVFLGMKHAARVMIPRRRGTIISTSGLASGTGGVASHAYACSKHAVAGLTKNLAVELGQFGIRVNCVSPYGLNMGIDADGEELESMLDAKANLNRGKRFVVDDVANAVLFLASEEASYVSGHNLFVDGGFGVQNSAIQLFNYPDDS